jgi:hypothetical protein
MASSKFKVGDSVKAVTDYATAITAGKTYTVGPRGVYISSTGGEYVSILNDFGWHGGYSLSRFELAPEKPKRKVYLAGPMTGIPDDNFPAFNAAAAVLKAAGLDVFNPADHGSGGDWAEYMKQDIPELLKCDAVVLLDGWTMSNGAQLENHIAVELGMPIYSYASVVGALELIGA